jgi:hypothetical protein
METAALYNKTYGDVGHITLPYTVSDELIDNLIKE